MRLGVCLFCVRRSCARDHNTRNEPPAVYGRRGVSTQNHNNNVYSVLREASIRRRPSYRINFSIRFPFVFNNYDFFFRSFFRRYRIRVITHVFVVYVNRNILTISVAVIFNVQGRTEKTVLTLTYRGSYNYEQGCEFTAITFFFRLPEIHSRFD